MSAKGPRRAGVVQRQPLSGEDSGPENLKSFISTFMHKMTDCDQEASGLFELSVPMTRCERRPENNPKTHKSGQAAGTKPSLKRKNSWEVDDVPVRSNQMTCDLIV